MPKLAGYLVEKQFKTVKNNETLSSNDSLRPIPRYWGLLQDIRAYSKVFF